MTEKTFKPTRVDIRLDLPATNSCEDRLVAARTLIHLLDEKVLGYMSVLYEGDGGKVDFADALASFKVRHADEKQAIVQARVEFIDGYPERDCVHNIGIVVDKNHLARGRDRAIGWWRANLERFDNVEKVYVLITATTDGHADDVTAEQLIWENGKEVK